MPHPRGTKRQGKTSLPFLTDRGVYFLLPFFAAFFPSLPSPFFISSFFIGAPAWDAATAKPLDTAKTAATNSDMSFFIQCLLSLSVIRMIRSPETGQPRAILAYIVERAKDSPDASRAVRRAPPAPLALARIDT